MSGATLKELAAELSRSGFRLGEMLAQTPNSRVFVAYRDGGERVAIKVLDSFSAADMSVLQNEIYALSRLSTSEYIVQIRGYGFEGVAPWLALEWCDAGNLEERLHAMGPMPVSEALRVGIAVSRALGAAAAVGVMHLDVKPGNILVSAGNYKLADFGLARALGQGASSWTPSHAAPEQARLAPLDEAADCYSVASTLYQLLSSNAPYGTGIKAIAAKRLPPEQIPMPDLSWVPTDDLRRYFESALDPVAGRRNPTSIAPLEEILCELQFAATGIIETPVLMGRPSPAAPPKLSQVPSVAPPGPAGPSAPLLQGPPMPSVNPAPQLGSSPLTSAPSGGTRQRATHSDHTTKIGHEPQQAAPAARWPKWVAGISAAIALLLAIALGWQLRSDPVDVKTLADQAAIEVAKSAEPKAKVLASTVVDGHSVSISVRPSGDGPYLLQRLEYSMVADPASGGAGSADLQRDLVAAGPVKRNGAIDEGAPARFAGAPAVVTATIDPSVLTCFRLLEADGESLQSVGAETCVPTSLPEAPVIDDPAETFAPNTSVQLTWTLPEKALVSDIWLVTYSDGIGELVSVKRLSEDQSQGTLKGNPSVCAVVIATNALQPVTTFEAGDELDLGMPGVSEPMCPWVDA